ncbi:MAG: diaminopimelate epimerase [Zetaproteobacteria bacterium]|nr:diaminopimelate epimerase [Zetaproteobacteria bacterium]
MMIPFTKMQAQGNDFIVLNALEHNLPALNQDFIRTITERRYGIGCDQLLVLLPSKHADAAMRIFNNDGSEAGNCGNGLRCAADLLMAELNINEVSIALADRVVLASHGKHGVRVEMGAAVIEQQSENSVQVDMGNPHTVFFEATEDFPHNRNVEIITGQVADHVYIDIIERGAGRTRACGTGACATVAAIWHIEGHHRPQTIEMPGGQVTVSGNMNQMMLEGSVAIAFTGHYYWQTQLNP